MIIQGTAIKGMTVSSSAAGITSDSYFNLVSLLLPGNGTNGAQNNTFLDSSTNNFTITRGGNATQGTFSPFSQTGWSNYFDGSGDYLTVADNAVLDMGSSSFTIEFWTYPTVAAPSSNAYFGKRLDSNTYGGINLYVNANGTVNLLATVNGSTWGINLITSNSITINQWNHIAVVRNGNVWTVYVNGTSGGSTTVSGTVPDNANAFAIGAGASNGEHTVPAGYLSNFRVVKGTAVYTSAFTPPTTPLTAITNTSLLTCQSNRFIDNSTNAFAITRVGNTSVQAFAPFDPTAAYSAGTVGGSGYFDGSSYLTVPDNAALDGFGDFTIEFWVNFNSSSNANILQKYGGVFDTYNFQVSGGNLLVYLSNGSSWLVNGAQAITGIVSNQWYHIAVTRSGSSIQIFRNGAVVATATSSSALQSDTGTVHIAQNNTFENRFVGYLSGLRIIKGTAVYTSSFTPPTAPVTAITNTSLLLNYTNAGISDAAAKNVLETVGGASISTAQSKWGGSAMAFDGSGDWLINPPSAQNQLGTGDFTVEFWFYSTSSADVGIFNISATSSSGSAGMAITKNTSNQITFWVNGNGGNTVTTSTYSINAWHHVALVRNGSTNTLYVDGVSAASNSNTPTWASTPCIGVGRPYNDNTIGAYIGYINDLRITRGYARYTANFTPPTAAFPTQ